ncbi:MAG: hypothetical protein OSB09_05080 [Planctomycetota bacterium]|nr:hypothetical protein [Planctomycetota bacterium]
MKKCCVNYKSLVFGSLNLVAAVLLLVAPIHAQNVVSVGSTAATPGQTVYLPVHIENDVAIAAYSFGLIHDPVTLNPVSIEYAGAEVPDFIGTQVGPDGLALGVVLDYLLVNVIPGGGISLAAYATYEVNSAGQGSFSTVTPGTAGSPPIDVVYSLPDASTLTPTVSSGGVAVLAPDPVGTPSNRVRVAFDGSFSAFTPDGVLAETDVISAGAPTDLLVDRHGFTWILTAENQTLTRIGDPADPKITVATGFDPLALGPLGGDGVFSTHLDGSIQVMHSDGTVLLGGDGAGDSPEDGVLGAALSIGPGLNLANFAAGSGSTSWLGGGTRLLRIQPNGAVVVDVNLGAGNVVQDLAAGPNGSVFVLMTTSLQKRVADGSLSFSHPLPTGIAPTRLAVTTSQTGDERIDRIAVLNPSSNQVLQLDWHHDNLVVAGPTITHARGLERIAWDGDRHLWIAGQESGSTAGTLTSYNSDGSATGVDLTFAGETILLTENSAAVPAVSAFEDDDFDGDEYSNINEQAAGSNPFDSADDPTDEVVDYTPPMNSLSSVIIGDNHFVLIEWTWSSPTADFPQFYEITRTTDGVLASGFPVQIAGTENSWIDENGGVGLPDGVHEYTGIAVMQGGSQGVTSVLVTGSGEAGSETPIDVPGSDGLTEIYDIAADPAAPPGGVKYYATDSLNGQIYALNALFEVLAVIPSPFSDGVPVTGITFIPTGDAGNGSLVVGNGSSAGQLYLSEITREGFWIRDYFLYNPVPWAPGDDHTMLPGAIPGSSGGMGYDENSNHLYITGPTTCEVYGMAHGGDGALSTDKSFAHPNPGAQQKGCTTGNCPGSGWIGCEDAPLYITSITADGTLEIIKVIVEGGVATQDGEGISLAAIDDPGGIVFDGENFVIAGNTSGTVYEVQVTGNFVRGDTNEDALVDIADGIKCLGYLFNGQPGVDCMARLDINDDNLIDVADPIYLLSFLFNAGAAPLAPFPDQGPDPTPSPDIPCP